MRVRIRSYIIMQAVPMSKQVNRVNIEPEILHGIPGGKVREISHDAR